MPLKWVEPELFFTHQGISIYHTYGNSDIDHRYENWFTTCVDENDGYEFDIRDLPVQDVVKVDGPKAIIKYAIENKLLKLPDKIKYID